MPYKRNSKSSLAKTDYWQGHVSSWSSSSLSHVEYSRRHGVAAHCLRYWIKKLSATASSDEPCAKAPGGVELVAVDLSSGSSPSEVDSEPPPIPFSGGQLSPLRVFVGERFVVEVCGDFDGAVFEKLVMILGRLL